MEHAGQAHRLQGDTVVYGVEGYARNALSFGHPLDKINGQIESLTLHEQRQLPYAERRYAYAFRRKATLNGLTRGLGQVPGLGKPPHPDVGVEQDHFNASQSSSPTGSKGAS